MTSLIIPTTSQNKDYTSNLVSNIKYLYGTKLEIILEESDKISLGLNYNNAVNKSSGDIIILLHNDMILHPEFITTIEKHITKGSITSYTRVEPPVYNDTYPGKIIQDFGTDLKDFRQKDFFGFTNSTPLVEGGSQLFFGCLREDYLGIDGYTFNKFCEDDDLHLRYKIAGFKHVVSPALVYHFVSKTSRLGDYKSVELESNLNFVKKWGFRKSVHNRVYSKKLITNNFEVPDYIKLFFSNHIREPQVVVSIKGSLTNEDIINIENLNDIIFETSCVGSYSLGNLDVDIINTDTLEKYYLKLDPKNLPINL